MDLLPVGPESGTRLPPVLTGESPVMVPVTLPSDILGLPHLFGVPCRAVRLSLLSSQENALPRDAERREWVEGVAGSGGVIKSRRPRAGGRSPLTVVG